MLPLREMGDRWQQRRHIALLLFLDDCCRVFARRCQVHARLRAIDFNEPFGPTADRADARAQSRTVATPFPATTRRARHPGELRIRLLDQAMTASYPTARDRFTTIPAS